MALRVGLIGLVLEACGLGRVYLRALSGACGLDLARTAGGRHQLGVWVRLHLTIYRWAINNQLRTGADKGTPTV